MYYCNRVVVKSPCKINLSLDITGRTENGYHLLDTVMHSADLSDVLVIGKTSVEEVRVTCSRPGVPENDTNSAHQAATAFFAATGLPAQGVSIHMDKAIPVEAGLAGGSADAAGVLCGLNRLFETGLEPGQLREIGLQVGADVPFCVEGGCALAQGVGEVLTPLPTLKNCRFAIAKPPVSMNTRYAFKLYDERQDELAATARSTQAVVDAVTAGNLAAVGAGMFNVFEGVSADEVELLKGIMLCDGALGAVMSGSGTAVVGLFGDDKQAKRCLRHLKEQDLEACLAKPLDHGAQILHVS